MNRTSTLSIIVGFVLIAVVARMFRPSRATRLHPVDAAAGTAHTAGKRRPFSNAVGELTFRSRSLNQGQEFLSATGRRVEDSDAAGARRRDDYETNVTTLGQGTS